VTRVIEQNTPPGRGPISPGEQTECPAQAGNSNERDTMDRRKISPDDVRNVLHPLEMAFAAIGTITAALLALALAAGALVGG
jgi:hypothetical protein